MRVKLNTIKSLFGSGENESVFRGLCTEHAIEEVHTWFRSAAETFRETHLLSFLRSCTDMYDAQILDVYDLLDSQARGYLEFCEFYFLVALLAAREEGQMVLFLYQRGQDAAQLLFSRSNFAAEGAGVTDKLSSRHLSFFLQIFELEGSFLETLSDLGLNRPDLAPKEILAVLFAICKEHDESVKRLSGIVDVLPPVVEEEDLEACAEGRGGDRAASKTRICSIS